MKKTIIATVSTAAIVLSSLSLSSCSPTHAYAGIDGVYPMAPGTTAYYGVGYNDKRHHHKPPKPPRKHKHHKPPKLKKCKHDNGKHRGHHRHD